VLTIAAINRMRVYIYVPERECGLVRRGQPAELRFEEFPGQVFHGVVTRYASALDLATRTMMTEIDIDNPSHKLYPRMYAHVTLELVRHPNAIELPTRAVQDLGSDSPFVYVVRHGRLSERPVKTGFDDGTNVEITSGLTGQELVVRDANPTMRGGEAVKFKFFDQSSVPAKRHETTGS
jgi:RND family efflux transporter MFP subunit